MKAPPVERARWPRNRSVDPVLPPLPLPRDPLLGRERERGELTGLLLCPDVALVSVTGVGGVGKTRLALAVAADLRGIMPDGVAFVALAAVTDAERVPAAIAAALSVAVRPGTPPIEACVAALHGRRTLLILDNVEQVAGAAPLLADILLACPELRLLVVSRARLGLRGEHELGLRPLALPEVGRSLTTEQIAGYGAVALFAARAREVQRDFTLDDANAGDVVEICRRLDGLPLAIELAVAWLQVLSPRALLARLDRAQGHSSLQFLTGGARDLPPRQQTLRDTIAWSYDLLTSSEQALFRSVSVFAGGFTLDAATAVSGDDGADGHAVLAGIASLVAKSVLQHGDQFDDATRFTMLGTIGEFAAEQLVASGQEPATRRRHALYFAEVADAALAGLWSAARGDWVKRLALEQDNLRAALTWAIEQGDGEIAMRVVAALTTWHVHDAQRTEGLAEGRASVEAVLTLPGAADHTPARGRLLLALGMWAHGQGDLDAARAAFRECVTIWRRAGDGQRLAQALAWLALASREDPDARHVYGAESIALCRETGDPWCLAHALSMLGIAAEQAGDATTATTMLEESVALYRSVGDVWSLGGVLRVLGYLAAARGDRAAARPLIAEGLELNRRSGDRRAVATCVVALAGLLLDGGRTAEAVRLFGAAWQVLDASGGLSLPCDRTAYARCLDEARQRLDDDAFTDAWTAGERLSLDEAIEEGLTPAAGRSGGRPTASPAPGLSARELEVLHLLAAGKRNREIAEALVISDRTVAHHIESVYRRLGLHTRAEAAAYAHRHGLTEGPPA